MEKAGAEKHPSPTVPIERIKAKLPAFVPLLKIFNIRYFKICNRIILLCVLLTLLASPAFGQLVQDIGSKMLVNNRGAALGRKLFSTRRDVFYNSTATNVSNRHHSNGSSVCLKEHRMERDVREESPRVKRRKERVGERERKLADEEDEDMGMTECSSCARDRIRVQSIESIKDSILSKLGMSQPPNVTEKPKPKIDDNLLKMILKKKHPHHGSNGLYWMVQEDDSEKMQGDGPYLSGPSDKVGGKNSEFSSRSNFPRPRGNASDNKYSDSSEFQEGEVMMEEEDDYHVRTEKIVAFSQPHPRIRHLPHVQYFELSEKLRTSKVRKAVLWMYVKGRESTNVVGNKITISIYKILDAGKPGSSGSRESPVITSVRAESTHSIPKGSGAWIMMEYVQIKNLVVDWVRYPQHNLGIVISAEDGNRTNLVVTSHGGNNTEFVPFLEVYVTDTRRHRTKRTVGLNCKDSSKETRCCRYPLTVDFIEFGWDWIIAPTKYDAFYCAGDCPMTFLPQHPHTHIFQLANTPGNGPCCAPRKLSELEILYYDQNMNLIYGKIPSMKVDRCGCA